MRIIIINMKEKEYHPVGSNAFTCGACIANIGAPKFGISKQYQKDW